MSDTGTVTPTPPQAEADRAWAEAVDRIQRAHAMNHTPTSVIGYCGESDLISAIYCETGVLLRAIASLRKPEPSEPGQPPAGEGE